MPEAGDTKSNPSVPAILHRQKVLLFFKQNCQAIYAPSDCIHLNKKIIMFLQNFEITSIK